MHPQDEAPATDEAATMADDSYMGDDVDIPEDDEFSPPNWTAEPAVSEHTPRAYIGGRFIRCLAAVVQPRVVLLGGLLDTDEGAALCAMFDAAIHGHESAGAEDLLVEDEYPDDDGEGSVPVTLAHTEAANDAGEVASPEHMAHVLDGTPAGPDREAQSEADDEQLDQMSGPEVEDPTSALGQEVLQQLDDRLEGMLNLFNVRTSGIGIYSVGHEGAAAIAPPDPAEAQAVGPVVGAVVVFLQSPAQGGSLTVDAAALSVPPVVGQAVFISAANEEPASLQWAHDPIAEGGMWMAVKWLFVAGENGDEDGMIEPGGETGEDVTPSLEAEAPRLLQ
jgi:hypothetical protein